MKRIALFYFHYLDDNVSAQYLAARHLFRHSIFLGQLSTCMLQESIALSFVFVFVFVFLFFFFVSECIFSKRILFLCLWPTWHLYLNCLPRKSIALPLSSLLGEPVQGFFFRWKITHFCKIWFKGSLTNAPIRESSLPQVSYLDRQFRWNSLCQRGIHWKYQFNIT